MSLKLSETQKKKLWWTGLALMSILLMPLLPHYCARPVDHTAEAVSDSDSLPMMHATGVNTLISDSGMMRYHMVTEEWDIFTPAGEAPTWKFIKGILMERFDQNFHIDLFIQADTAYFRQQRLWELRGRVVIRNIKNEVFRTEELFWDLTTHEIWSHKFMRIITPDRELQGTEFRSNEYMTMYSINNSAGAIPVEDTQPATQMPDSTAVLPPDTVSAVPQAPHQPMSPHRKGQLPPNGVPGKRFLPAPDKRQ